MGDPGAIVDYQTRFTSPFPWRMHPAAKTPTPHERPDHQRRVGALNEEERTARIDLTSPLVMRKAREQKVLMKSQAVVRLSAWSFCACR